MAVNRINTVSLTYSEGTNLRMMLLLRSIKYRRQFLTILATNYVCTYERLLNDFVHIRRIMVFCKLQTLSLTMLIFCFIDLVFYSKTLSFEPY